jgi:starch synthase (maltosyl-transferring)
VNAVRRATPALQNDRSLRFHEIDNDQLICFSKTDEAASSSVLVVINLDPHHRQSGWTFLDLHALGIGNGETFQVHDLVSDARFLWRDESNFVELDPGVMPAHVFRVRRRVRTEEDFDYFL